MELSGCVFLKSNVVLPFIYIGSGKRIEHLFRFLPPPPGRTIRIESEIVSNIHMAGLTPKQFGFGKFSARFVGGGGRVNPPLVHLNPQVFIDPQKIVKISQKYFADPLWISHKSSTW